MWLNKQAEEIVIFVKNWLDAFELLAERDAVGAEETFEEAVVLATVHHLRCWQSSGGIEDLKTVVAL